MNKENTEKDQSFLRKGWSGQAVIEYMPTLALVGAFTLAVLSSVGAGVAQNFSAVARCMDGGASQAGADTMFVAEPEQNNAQNVLIEYPSECADFVVDSEASMVVELGTESYIDAHLTGAFEGTFNAWCVDYQNGIKPGTVYKTPTYTDMSTSVDRPENLPLVQWLINYNWQANGYEIMDVQGAIWLLIDDTKVKTKHLGPRAVELAQLAIAVAGDANTDPTLKY